MNPAANMTPLSDDDLTELLGFEVEAWTDKPTEPRDPSPALACEAATPQNASASGPQNAAMFRKRAEALAACATAQRIIIQAKPSNDPKGFFFVYDSLEALDSDEAALRACRFVREIVNPRFQRRAFADIDTKRHSVSALANAWACAWPGCDPPTVYSTTKGFHIVAPRWATVQEHRRGLAILADLLPGKAVDVAAVHSLRLAGTLDKFGPGRKEHPAGLTLSATLVQPLGAPFDHEADSRKIRAVAANVAATAAEVAAGVAALTEDAAAFEVDPEQSTGDRVVLRRVEASGCRICEREHDGANAFLILEAGKAVGRAYCYQSKKGARFKRPGVVEDPAGRYPGPFSGRSGTVYERADGVAAAPAGDYIEGSPCGLGKSKAAWASIDENLGTESAPSVLLASYRKTFSASQGGLHGCEQYGDSTGDIAMTPGRRMVCQYESLRRVKGIPEVFAIDEFHGLRRQACGGIASAEAWGVLVRLVKDAGRVIVLDAYADDSDLALLSEIRGRPLELVRNVYKPHASKTVRAFASFKDHKAAFDRFAQEFAARPREWRLANRFVVVCQWRADVEGIASQLELLGLRGKAYHGKTCAKTRAAEFANHAEAWAGAEFVVYNSTLEAGVSVEGPEWVTAWVLMRGMGHVEAAIQGLHRFRNVKTFNTFAARHHGGGDYPTSEAGIVAAILEGEKFAAGDHYGPGVDDEPEVDKRGELNAAAYVAKMVRLGDDYTRSSFARMWIANQLEGNRSARFWPARFYAMLADTGFEVRHIPAGAVVDALAEVEKKEPSDLEAPEAVTFKDSPAARTAGASAEVWQAVLEQHKGEAPARDLSAAEIHSRDKCALMCEYVQPEGAITEEFVEMFGGIRETSAHRNTRLLMRTGGASHTEAAESLRRLEGCARNGPRKDLAPRIATQAEKAARTLEALQALGFTGLEDSRAIRRHDVEKGIADNAAKLAAVYKSRGRLWPDIRAPKPATSLKAHLGAVNGILEAQYAAKVIAVNKRNDRFRIEVLEWPDNLLSAWRGGKSDVPPPKATADQVNTMHPLEELLEAPASAKVNTMHPLEEILEILADFGACSDKRGGACSDKRGGASTSA
jgi:hypothetical protein